MPNRFVYRKGDAIPEGAMSFLDLARWAQKMCRQLDDDDCDPSKFYPVVQAHYVLREPANVLYDRHSREVFLVGVQAI